MAKLDPSTRDQMHLALSRAGFSLGNVNRTSGDCIATATYISRISGLRHVVMLDERRKRVIVTFMFGNKQVRVTDETFRSLVEAHSLAIRTVLGRD